MLVFWLLYFICCCDLSIICNIERTIAETSKNTVSFCRFWKELKTKNCFYLKLIELCVILISTIYKFQCKNIKLSRVRGWNQNYKCSRRNEDTIIEYHKNAIVGGGVEKPIARLYYEKLHPSIASFKNIPVGFKVSMSNQSQEVEKLNWTSSWKWWQFESTHAQVVSTLWRTGGEIWRPSKCGCPVIIDTARFDQSYDQKLTKKFLKCKQQHAKIKSF